MDHATVQTLRSRTAVSEHLTAESDSDHAPSVAESSPDGVETPKGPVNYKLQWLNHDGDLLRNFASDTPFNGLKLPGKPLPTKSEEVESDMILEVVQTVKGPWSSMEMVGDSIRKKTVDDIVVSELKPTRLILHSQLLTNAIRDTVPYYPGQVLTGKTMEITEPYPVLMHYLDELKMLHKRHSEQAEEVASEDGRRKGSLYYHLGILLDFLLPISLKTLRPIQERLEMDDPVVTFDTVWYLFRPGSDVYVKSIHNGSDVVHALVFMEIRPESLRDAEERGQKPGLVVVCFNLESNGTTINRNRSTYIKIDHFEGERDVLSLKVYPCKYWDSRDGGARRRDYIKAGEKHFQILRKGHAYMKYSGYIYSSQRLKYDNTPVIVDLEAALRYKNRETDIYLRGFSFLENPMSGTHRVWKGYDNIDLKSTENLTEHQCFLLALLIAGFVLKDKSWRIFDVRKLSEVAPSEGGMENLVMKPSNIGALRAVCETQEMTWKIDFIESKGDGQIILLHGPPGVGKTYTVEAICESYGRPLITLTVADIGLEDETIEDKLVKWFILAERWRGVLLLDEADIFMEKRTRADVKRNALVSVFLRQMEYFKGLFFLTTNRIGQIDDAFLSRVSLVIGYGKLDHGSRAQIWHGFFAKLQADMDQHRQLGKKPIIEIDRYAKKYVLHDDEVQRLEWNGREIRNALQTAITLATYQASKNPRRKEDDVIEVEEEHFRSVVQMSQSFRDYMDSIPGISEAERAMRARDRNDRFGVGE